MTQRKRFVFHSATVFLIGVACLAFAADAAAFDWTPYREDSTIEILTVDEDGSLRETKIWIVVLDEFGYVRTNDSKWLANIRRDPAMQLRTRGVTTDFVAEEVDDESVYDRVEQAFKDKYGWIQKLMSSMRMSRPTVLRIEPPVATASADRR